MRFRTFGPIGLASAEFGDGFSIESPTRSEVWFRLFWRVWWRVASRKPSPVEPLIRSVSPREHARHIAALNESSRLLRD